MKFFKKNTLISLFVLSTAIVVLIGSIIYYQHKKALKNLVINTYKSHASQLADSISVLCEGE